MKKLIAQFMKFGVVGALAFVIDYGLLGLLKQVIGIHYLIANTISFSVSVIFNYVVSMKFVFEGRDNMSKSREFTIFIILSVIGLLINNGIIALAAESFKIHVMVSKIFATAVVMVWNFVSRKILLEKKTNNDIITTN